MIPPINAVQWCSSPPFKLLTFCYKLHDTQDYYQGLRASLSFKHNNSHNAHHKLKDVEITFVQKQKQLGLLWVNIPSHPFHATIYLPWNLLDPDYPLSCTSLGPKLQLCQVSLVSVHLLRIPIYLTKRTLFEGRGKGV